MINGVHFLIYSSDPEADRAFFRDVLSLPFVDAGHGWLIFALPPTELAIHPADSVGDPPRANEKLAAAVVYLLCDNLAATVETLAGKGVACTAIEQQRWGATTTFRLPSGSKLGLYEPRHPLAIAVKTA